jgi:hypothetical protein
MTVTCDTSPFSQGFLTIGFTVVGSSSVLGSSLRLRENHCGYSGFALGGVWDVAARSLLHLVKAALERHARAGSKGG